LIKGADWMVRSASELARSFGVSTMIIGLTVIAIGTSLPEAAIGVMASINQTNQITLGTVIGSSIANITFIIGVAAIMHPLKVEPASLSRDIPLAFLTQIVFLLFLLTGRGINRLEAVMLLVAFVGFLVYLGKSAGTAKRLLGDTQEESVDEKRFIRDNRWKHIIITLGGLACVALGSELVVDNARKIAMKIGLSEAVIGVTIVALGTSLPELVVGIVSVSHKEHELMVGNIIGSNIFNILFVLGISATIHPIDAPAGIWVNLVSMFLAMLVFWGLALRNRHISRMEGIILLSLYLVFLGMTITVALF